MPKGSLTINKHLSVVDSNRNATREMMERIS